MNDSSTSHEWRVSSAFAPIIQTLHEYDGMSLQPRAATASCQLPLVSWLLNLPVCNRTSEHPRCCGIAYLSIQYKIYRMHQLRAIFLFRIFLQWDMHSRNIYALIFIKKGSHSSVKANHAQLRHTQLQLFARQARHVDIPSYPYIFVYLAKVIGNAKPLVATPYFHFTL